MADFFRDAQAAFAFVRSQTQNYESEIYDIEYPMYNYRDYIPVVTEGSRFASGTTFYTRDIVGKSEWLGNDANDVPYVDLLRGEGSQTYHTRATGYRWTWMEVNRAALAGINLSSEKAEGAREIMERFLFDLAMSGNDEKDMKGFINYGGITAGDVLANGSDSLNTAWSGKDADEIIADIRIGFDAIRTATLETRIPNTLALPPATYSLLATKRISAGGDGTMSVLDYIMTVFGKAYNTPFSVKSLRQLTGADPGGDGRAILYSNDRKVLRFHLPGVFEFRPVHPVDSLTWEQIGLATSGGTEIRLPKAVLYMDGIEDDTP